MAARNCATLLCGPAGAGKSAAAMELYRQRIGPDGRARCLLVLPNGPAVAAAKATLLAESGGTVLAPQVMTFASLAQRILSAAAVPARMIPPTARQLLLRSIVDSLHQAGKLQALSRVAQTPGVIAAVDRSIAELKRAASEPDDLAAAMRALGGQSQSKIADLLEIYGRYQHYLQSHGLYDVEGQMWQARDELVRLGDQWPPAMSELTAMAVDGFTDFTPTQLRILAMLQRRMEAMLITLPLAADGRARLWHWTAQTRERICAAFGERLRVLSMPEGPSATHVLAHDRLFDLAAPPAPPPSTFRVIAAAGIEAEVAAVSRRVKRLLVRGSPPGSVAVLARSLDPYLPTIQRVFREHDIPIAHAGESLVGNPLVRFLLAAADIAPEFNFRDVLTVIKSSYFLPEALGPFDSRTAAAAEAIIRQGNVLQGRQSYADAAARLIQRAQRKAHAYDEGGDGQASCVAGRPEERIAPALAMLTRLFDLAQAAQSGDLAQLAEAMAMRQSACRAPDAGRIARDLRSLAALEAALRQVSGMAPLDADSSWRPSLAELSRALAAASVPAERGESLVDVMDVLDARALRYEHVFLLGVGEGVFPRRFVESSLIGEADRQAWRKSRIELDRRGDLTAREMLLFYLAATRAAGSLTVSFLASDASGKPSSASPFLLSLLDSLGGLQALETAGLVERVTAGQFLPPPAEIATRRDAFNAAFARGMGILPSVLECGASKSATRSDAGGTPATHADGTSATLQIAARGLFARHRRWMRAACDCYDGRLSDPELLRELSDRFPGKTVFSASQFGSYGQCPWQFFASYVLGLEPLTEPQRTLEAVDVGDFCHAVLFRTLASLKEPGKPLVLQEVDKARLMEALDAAVAAQSRLVESRRPPYPTLWQIQRREMRAALRGYLSFHHDLAGLEGGPTHFELSFGAAENDEQLQDGRSRAAPVHIKIGASEFLLRGRIDRVDHVALGTLAGLLVVDYKTGRLPSDSDMDEGRNLQLPLYAAAAEQLLGGASLGGTFHHVGEDAKMKFFAAIGCRNGTFSEKSDYPQRRDAALAEVQEFIDGMREGRFDLLPTRKCPSWCAFRRICHFSPARLPLKKTKADGGDE